MMWGWEWIRRFPGATLALGGEWAFWVLGMICATFESNQRRRRK